MVTEAPATVCKIVNNVSPIVDAINLMGTYCHFTKILNIIVNALIMMKANLV